MDKVVWRCMLDSVTIGELTGNVRVFEDDELVKIIDDARTPVLATALCDLSDSNRCYASILNKIDAILRDPDSYSHE